MSIVYANNREYDSDYTEPFEICDACGLWETNLSRCISEDCENVEEAKTLAGEKARI